MTGYLRGVMRWVRILGAFGAGGVALAILWSERFAYGDFLPLRGYQPLHAHVIAPQEGLFLGLFVVLGAIAVLGLGIGAFLTSTRGGQERLIGRLDRVLQRVPDRAWMIALALFAVVAALVVGGVVLDGAFMTDDEMAMNFQAELLLEGRLWADPTPYPEVFSYAMMIEAPRWYGIYPIGHPAVMALSLLLTGSARYLVALCAAGWVVLTFLLARRLFDRTTAVLASALMCLSPFFVLSSGTLAAEITSGLFLLAAANAAVRIEGRRPLLMSVALGLSLGAAYLSRPYTTLAFAVPLAVWVARPWFRKRTSLWVPFVVLACAAPFAVGYLWVNAGLTDSPWLTPYEVNFPGRFKIGFGQDAFGIVHTPQLAAAVAGLTLFELNAWVLGWPLSLIPVACALFLERISAPTLLAASLPLCMMLAFVPVPMAGVQDTGPLYYLEVLPLLVILAARGLLLAGRRVSGWWGGRGRELLAWQVVAAAVVGGLTFGWQQVDVLRSLAAFNNAPYEVAERVVDGRALIFVDNIQTTPPSSWVLGLRPPRHDLSDRLVFGHVVGRSRADEVLRWTDGRRGYYLSRDRVTGDVSLIPLAAP